MTDARDGLVFAGSSSGFGGPRHEHESVESRLGG